MDKDYFSHDLALVESTNIGANTRIWAWAHVMPGATIGRNCNIGEQCFVEGKAVIGNDCTLKNGVAFYDGVILEDNVFIGPAVVFTNDKYPRSKGSWEMLTTLIKKGTTIGAGAVIVPGLEIGPYAMVGAGSVVTRNVVPFGLVVGSPARLIGYACQCGRPLSRTLELPEPPRCEHCNTSYRFNGSELSPA